MHVAKTVAERLCIHEGEDVNSSSIQGKCGPSNNSRERLITRRILLLPLPSARIDLIKIAPFVWERVSWQCSSINTRR